jgi:hypothetical protein
MVYFGKYQFCLAHNKTVDNQLELCTLQFFDCNFMISVPNSVKHKKLILYVIKR